MTTAPKKLGKYEIQGKLGKGAMGEVYKGHDPVLHRHVAIKVIAETLDAQTDVVERFKREARNAAQLNHPNIVTIYDFVEDEGRLYMVMELLEGQDLKEIIKSGVPLTMEQILSFMEQVADGLGFAHSKDIIHRDLKPANIYVNKNGQVKILDFGLVHEASSDMTKTGQVMGTPNYMSPEQVQGQKVEPCSDIFSLGAVFYEILTRKKPFGADSIHATMYKVVQGEREPLSKYTHLPKPIVSMVDRALDKSPERRFRDANELREHLRVVRNEVMRGKDADSTMLTRAEATVLTPAADPTSMRSTSSAGSEKSAPSRSGPSVSASGSRGTIRRGDAAATGGSFGAASSNPLVAYALGAVLLVGIAAGAYFVMSGSDSAEQVEELSRALSESQRQLMRRSLEQKDYAGALAQAEEILASLPGDADALEVQAEAERLLAEVEASVAEARSALEQGDSARAADALARVLELDPAHPLATELAGQLNEHFQRQADTARTAMESARSAASSAGAGSRPEYARADRIREQATSEFNSGQYTHATQLYHEARDQFDQSRSAHRQAEAQRQVQANRAAEEAAASKGKLETELRQAEASWNQARRQATSPGLDRQPSYQRAMSEEQLAKRLANQGDLEGATRSFEGAVAYLERARRELAEEEAAKAREEARRAEARPQPAPPPPPVSTTATPTREQEESAIRQVLANYERAIESKNLDLFRQVKPNLTADEEKGLRDSFTQVDSQAIEIAIASIVIEGDMATVTVSRRDTFVVRGRSENGNERQQRFVLSKTGDRWTIVSIS
ncbi:MAG TPA: protein kinase [Vicinamibacteria bacterium]|nr:protein kinase [Vicinamibacteria bacterium]